MFSFIQNLSVAWKTGLIVGGISLLIAVAMTISAYFIGYNKGTAKAELEIQKAVNRAQELELSYNELVRNPILKVVTEYKDKWHTIEKEKIKYVEVAKEVPSGGELSTGWVEVHNAAALGKDPSTVDYTNATPSGVKDSQALPTVTNNYGTYKQCVANLNALQDIIEAHEKAVKEANKKGKK